MYLLIPNPLTTAGKDWVSRPQNALEIRLKMRYISLFHKTGQVSKFLDKIQGCKVIRQFSINLCVSPMMTHKIDPSVDKN